MTNDECHDENQRNSCRKDVLVIRTAAANNKTTPWKDYFANKQIFETHGTKKMFQ